MAKSSKSSPPQSPNPREEAARILQRVLQDDAYANRMLDASLQDPGWDERDRGFLTELVYGCLRHLYPIDAVIDGLARKGLRSIDPMVLGHLRVAVYQILFLDGQAAHAVTSEAVRLVRKRRGGQGGKAVSGFVNGMLRRLLREKEARLAAALSHPDPMEQLALESSHPRWWVERLVEAHGLEAAALHLQANNQPAPMVLRIHPGWATRDAALERLQEAGISAEATAYSGLGVRVATGQGGALRAFRQLSPHGFAIQDEAAQLLAPWLDPQDAEQILDACAAPGGKTTHLASLAPGAAITALDIHEHKIALIRQSCRQLQIENVQVHQADATQPLPQSYHRILCDAPCSGFGVVRRQPEIRYRRGPADLQELASLQLRLLNNLAQWVEPGGILLYSVCTTTLEETEQVVDAFLQQHPEFALEPAGFPAIEALLDARGFLRTSPHEHGMDGFFAARFQREK